MIKEQAPATIPPTFREFVVAFARIGVLSFGGPAAQIALMHSMVVDERRWLREDRFLHALNYCMILPGPEAQQLATYIGWLMFGWRGGVVAGLLFVLPGLFVIITLSALYTGFYDTYWLAGLFFGLKAAVLAIVVQALIRLASRALKTAAARVIAVGAFIALFFFSLPFPVVVLLAGLAGLGLAMRRPALAMAASQAAEAAATRNPGAGRMLFSLVFWLAVWQAPLVLLWLFGDPGGLVALFSFFSRMALVTFGGAYAVLAYVAQVAVEQYHWLKPGEMLDGLALAETTPGPLVLVLSFVGYVAGYRQALSIDPVAGGLLGALLTAWATFVPSFVWIFAGAPYIERLRGNRLLDGALSAITAAVVGVIFNLALWFALHVLFRHLEYVSLWDGAGLLPAIGFDSPVWQSVDFLALAIFAAALFLLLRMRMGMERLLVIAALAGLAGRSWGWN